MLCKLEKSCEKLSQSFILRGKMGGIMHKNDILLNLFCDAYYYEDSFILWYDYYNDEARIIELGDLREEAGKLIKQIEGDGSDFVDWALELKLLTMKKLGVGRFNTNIICDDHKAEYADYICDDNRVQYVN